MIRQLAALIPAAWMLAQTGVVNDVWWAFLIAEVISLMTSIFFFKKVYRNMIEPFIT